jgi:RNA polymerase sigma factor (sigma-70 family)
MDIENLVKKAQSGDVYAAESLYERFMPLLKSAAAQTHIRCIYEDAFATASLSFLEAIHAYQEDMLIPFAGYANAKVYGDLRTLFKRERRNWQRELSANCALSENNALQDTFAATSFETQSTDKMSITNALKELPFEQKSVLFHRFFCDYTQAKTAKQLKTSQQSIAAREKRALQFLKQLLKNP